MCRASYVLLCQRGKGRPTWEKVTSPGHQEDGIGGRDPGLLALGLGLLLAASKSLCSRRYP